MDREQPNSLNTSFEQDKGTEKGNEKPVIQIDNETHNRNRVNHFDVWKEDIRTTQKYAMDHRTVYTLWHQMSKLSRDKGALVHDDRIDSLAGAVRPWVDRIAVNEEVRMSQKRTNTAVQFMNDWASHGSQEQRVAEGIESRARAGIVQNKALQTNSRRRRR